MTEQQTTETSQYAKQYDGAAEAAFYAAVESLQTASTETLQTIIREYGITSDVVAYAAEHVLSDREEQ